MAVKSGISHTLATILGMVISAIFVEYVKIWVPTLFKILDKIGIWIFQWLYKYVGVKIPQDIFVPLLVASFLAFLWGVLYHAARFR